MPGGINNSRVHGVYPLLDKNGLKFLLPTNPGQVAEDNKSQVHRKDKVASMNKQNPYVKHTLRNELDMVKK